MIQGDWKLNLLAKILIKSCKGKLLETSGQKISEIDEKVGSG